MAPVDALVDPAGEAGLEGERFQKVRVALEQYLNDRLRLSRDQVAANIPEAVARIRRHTRLPVAVGFGGRRGSLHRGGVRRS